MSDSTELLKAIERLKEDIVRIESCKSIDAYVRGPRDIIHERLDGLVEYINKVDILQAPPELASYLRGRLPSREVYNE